MSYTAKHWTNPVNISADNMNELELGVQEAHEGIDRLEKIIPGLQSENNDILKELEKVTSGTSDAFNLLKDIQNTLESEPDLAVILKQNSENFLLKTSQPLTNIEKQQVLKNLGLNKYTFLEDIIVNGNQITNGVLNLKIPGIDTELNRNSQNAVANYAIVKALENFGTPDLNRYMDIHNESTTAHMDIRELINSKASTSYVIEAIKNIPVPDVSGQISEHDLDSSAHKDIRNLIKNIDLSGYALINHNHDEVYAPIQHNHSYAAEDHTHNYATPEYVDNKVNSIEIPNVSTEIHYHNTSDTSHQDIRDAIKNIDLSGYSKTDHTHNDYLPLTAGVDKKVTGALHVDNNITISNGKAYRAYDNSGTIRELLRLSTGNVIILGDGNSNLDIATHGILRPSAGKLLNLGTATYPWTNIYGTTIYQNGKQVANKEDIPDISNIDLSGYSKIGHKHDDAYAPITHSHDYATPSYVDTAIANLVGAAPDALNTFEELAAALNNNKDILSTFLTKNNPSGTGSFSLNRNSNYAIGENSVVMGSSCAAIGNSSYANGNKTFAYGDFSHAEGSETIAVGSASHVEGYSHSSSLGFQVVVAGSDSVKLKNPTSSSDIKKWNSLAVGDFIEVEISNTPKVCMITAKNPSEYILYLDIYDITEETLTNSYIYTLTRVSVAGGLASHAEGYYAKAYGNFSHAEGSNAIAKGEASHAEGYYTKTYGNNNYGNYSHAEGSYTISAGKSSHSEGGYTFSNGDYSHAEGVKTYTGDYSHAEGYGNLDKKFYVNVDYSSTGMTGSNLTALYFKLHEDSVSNATQLAAFENLKQGDFVYVVGLKEYICLVKTINLETQIIKCSIINNRVTPRAEAEKWSIQKIQGGLAIGEASHCEGVGTLAITKAQHVFGMANIPDPEYSSYDPHKSKGTYIEIVGNGEFPKKSINDSNTVSDSEITRSNARTLDWDGNEWLAGGLTTVGTITEAGTLLSDKYASKNHNHDSVYLSKTTGGTVSGPVSFTGTVGNTQSTAGIYLGLDQNTGAENANMAIVSANTAAYIDMGRPNVDYDFRIIKWNNSGNTNAQLVYGGNAYGTITIPQADGTMALAENVPNIYKGTSSTQSSNTTSVKTLRLGLVGSTLYIWTS